MVGKEMVTPRIRVTKEGEDEALDFVASHDDTLRLKYVELLASEQSPEAFQLELGDIPRDVRDVREQELKEKLKEYTDRVQDEQREKQFWYFTPVSMERDVLATLLDWGVVNTYTLGSAFKQAYGRVDYEMFSDACAVIGSFLQAKVLAH